MTETPRAVAIDMIAAIEKGFAERGLDGRMEIFFPPKGGDFEVRGEGLRLIIEVNRGFGAGRLNQRMARWFNQGPVQVRLRAWFLNEFVERLFPDAREAVPIIFSILEAHRPSGLAMPLHVSGAPELDSPGRPSLGADD